MRLTFTNRNRHWCSSILENNDYRLSLMWITILWDVYKKRGITNGERPNKFFKQ